MHHCIGRENGLCESKDGLRNFGMGIGWEGGARKHHDFFCIRRGGFFTMARLVCKDGDVFFAAVGNLAAARGFLISDTADEAREVRGLAGATCPG
jgi:hypothetical protein